MEKDSDPIVVSNSKPDDLVHSLVDIALNIEFKFHLLMLAVFIILSSDVFIGRILARFSGAVDTNFPTSWGVVLQGMFLVIACIIIDVAIRHKII
jgi:hypothetical protein